MSLPISHLRDAHKGRVGVVLGAGPCLPSDLKIVPKNAVYYSCNAHPLLDKPDADYIVYSDKRVGETVKDYKIPRISPHEEFADYVIKISQNPINVGDIWTSGQTGHVATTLALYMGCSLVILTGMDLYMTGEYVRSTPGAPFKPRGSKERKMLQWRKGLQFIEYSKVRVASGPLIEIFGEYK